MKQSKFMNLGKRDVFNGLIMAMLSAACMIAYEVIKHWLNSSTWYIEGIDWMLLVKTSINASVMPYLIKNFFTKGSTDPSRDEEINWLELIQNCLSLDDLGDLEELPIEYYPNWCDKYAELGLGNNYPSYDEIRAGSVGTSGPKK